MLYRAEIMKNKKIVSAGNFEAEHPAQAIRKITEHVDKKQLDYANVFIVNKVGNTWVYNVKRTHNGMLDAILIRRNLGFLPEHITRQIFAGNINIIEVA